MKKIILSISLWLAATAAFATTQAQDDEDKPPLVFLYGDEAESRDHSDTYQDFYWLYSDGSTQADFSVDDQLWWYSEHIWILGLGGAGMTSSGETEYSWDSFGDESVDDDQKSVWNFDLDGTGAGGGNEIYYAYGTATSTNSDSLDILPDIGNEHCDVTDGYPPPAYWPGGSAPGLQILGHATEIYQRTAQTMWHVQTGGKAVPGRLNLWQFTGSAAQLLNLRAQPPFTYASTQPINPTQVALGGLGNLQADGTLWVTLPDGIEEDVTPTVSGLNFYNFSVGGSKYLSHFEVFVRQPDPGGTANYTGFITSRDYGHAWWCLSSDAPANVITQQLVAANFNPDAANQLSVQEGYGHSGQLSFSLIDFDYIDDGVVYAPSSPCNTNGTYAIGFPQLLGGLNWVQGLINFPGTYMARKNNCAEKAEALGAFVGVPLPQTEYPEVLGNNLPPGN